MFNLFDLIKWILLYSSVYLLFKYFSDYISGYLIHQNHAIDNTKDGIKIMYDIRSLNNQVTPVDRNEVKEVDKQSKYSETNIHLLKELIDGVMTVVMAVLPLASSSFISSIWLISLAWDLYVLGVMWNQHDYNQKNEDNKNEMMPKINQCANGVILKLKRRINQSLY